MNKQELIKAAQRANETWSKKLGQPKFKLLKNRPITDFPIRWKFIGIEGSRFAYAIYAQATLDHFAELEALNTPNLVSDFSFSHGGEGYRVKARNCYESDFFQE